MLEARELSNFCVTSLGENRWPLAYMWLWKMLTADFTSLKAPDDHNLSPWSKARASSETKLRHIQESTVYLRFRWVSTIHQFEWRVWWNDMKWILLMKHAPVWGLCSCYTRWCWDQDLTNRQTSKAREPTMAWCYAATFPGIASFIAEIAEITRFNMIFHSWQQLCLSFSKMFYAI